MVQSMTNTLTTNVKETIKQINDCVEEGAELVRVSCPDEQSTKSLKEIVKNRSPNHYRYSFSLQTSYRGSCKWCKMFEDKPW